MLKDQPPPINQRQPATPRALERLVRKCLEKKADDRWQSARDLKPALELIDVDAPPVSTYSSSVPIPAPAASRKKWLWMVAGGSAVVAIAAALWVFRPKPHAAGHVTRFEVPLPAGAFVNPAGFYLRVSPDGTKLAFTMAGPRGGIWVRDLESVEARLLPGTENAVAPMWSPDSHSLAYGVGNQLMRIDLAGGPPEKLAESTRAGIRAGFWSERGEIVFGPGILQRVPQSGGIPTPVTALAKSDLGHTLPSLLPDGRRFLYRRGYDLYVGSLDVRPEEQSLAKIMPSPFGVEFVRDGNSSDGNLFFLRETTLLAQHFDTKTLKFTGDAIPVAQNVGSGPQHGHFSVTAGGVLAYRARGVTARQLTWVDRQGRVLKTIGEPGEVLSLSLAPNGSQVALFRSDTGNALRGDLWLLDLSREIETRFTFGQNVNLGAPVTRPVWTRDSKRLTFRVDGNIQKMVAKPANGAGEMTTLLEGPAIPWDWSKDGRDLIDGNYGSIQSLRVGTPGAAPMTVVSQTNGTISTTLTIGTAALSPDDRWIAYSNLASGNPQVFVQPYNAPGQPARAGGKYQLSRSSGGYPRWRADGKELLFISPTEGLMAVQVDFEGDALRASAPVKLFDLSPEDAGLWDVAPDGQHFLVAKRSGGANPPITVVENWRAALKK